MGSLPESLRRLINDACVIEIVPDNARRPAFSLTEYNYLYECDDTLERRRRRRGSQEQGEAAEAAGGRDWQVRKRSKKELHMRTMDRWQSSKVQMGNDSSCLVRGGGSWSSRSVPNQNGVGTVCPRSPRLPIRRTSGDSNEASNSRKPLQLPVRRSSNDLSDLKHVRRSTSSSTSGDSMASFREGGLSTVIGKLLSELQEIDLLSSDDEEDEIDDDASVCDDLDFSFCQNSAELRDS